jgi:hypothetical protein
VYTDPPINLQYLKDEIRAACNKLTKAQISAATKNQFILQTEICFEKNEHQFEQVIRYIKYYN